MHYLIDGYNMLFRLVHTRDNLQTQRQYIIHDLNKKVALLNLDVSLVFDATFQEGDRTRSHFDHLEILFTAEGETADEFILDELKNCSNPQQQIVITSDKKLAQQARLYSAQTETVEKFITRLNKNYEGKLKSTKKKELQANKQAFLIQTQTKLAKKLFSKEDLPFKSTQEKDYETIFEARFQELIITEKTQKKGKQASESPKKLAKNKKISSNSSFAQDGLTPMERWLKIFEDRLNQ
jgi:predicted RNA-binding protein with PIN domain